MVKPNKVFDEKSSSAWGTDLYTVSVTSVENMSGSQKTKAK
ncbi:hypothetical protein C2W64_04278 [Brevibacillus laterosporus]|nr:hypothetical protein [Brevibacillus laterosporus]RAP19129.1 hypothetical protein C2W64_04278 [Brevibacillus laterosporus]